MSEETLYGVNLFGEPNSPPRPNLTSERFLIPPFSVLNAREGFWQERKRAWISLGIKSELGRGENIDEERNLLRESQERINKIYNKVSPGGSPRPAMDYSNRERGTGNGKPLISNGGGMNSKERYAKTYNTKGLREGDEANKYNESLDERTQKALGCHMAIVGGAIEREAETGTSIFDPVLCEALIHWFCPKTGLVLDPFAGGSVRGIVSAVLKRKYYGIDLSAAQVRANEEQAVKITPDNLPAWIVGDSKTELTNAPDADFILTCPPYGDLEVYSDDPADLSTMPYNKFIETYNEIIKSAVGKLRQNSYAAIVVGDFRDKAGHYRNFVSDTITAFLAAGCKLYNEAILITAVGSLPIRITKQFNSGRKMGKTHQNVLIFIKGDWRKATEKLEVLDEIQSNGI